MKSTSYPTPTFIALAPMEGIVDNTLRDIFSSIGGLDRCVTEFIRITSQRLPERVFRRIFPEIDEGSKTPSGTDVFAQILGDNADSMADNAIKLTAMGATGIDINFGCPAKTVNNHGGGSVLLKDPEKIYQIIKSIRSALPKYIPVTAKIRLGFKDKSLFMENVQAIASAGACQLTVHARTKIEGYKPPAHWDYIALIQDNVDIDVIANGEMWSVSDIHQCMKTSGCNKIMLGRGLIASPELALRAKGSLQEALYWGDICLLLIHYLEKLSINCSEIYQHALIKQWLVYLRQQYGEAYLFFQQIKRIKSASVLKESLIKELKDKHIRQPISGHIGHLNLQPLLERIISHH